MDDLRKARVGQGLLELRERFEPLPGGAASHHSNRKVTIY